MRRRRYLVGTAVGSVLALVGTLTTLLLLSGGTKIAGMNREDRIVLLGKMADDAVSEMLDSGQLTEDQLVVILNQTLARRGGLLQVYTSQPAVPSGLSVGVVREHDTTTYYFVNAIERNAYRVTTDEMAGIGKDKVDALMARQDVDWLWIGTD